MLLRRPLSQLLLRYNRFAILFSYSPSLFVEIYSPQESENGEDGNKLLEEHRLRLEEVEKAREKAEKERKRREEDLEAAKALNDELRRVLQLF